MGSDEHYEPEIGQICFGNPWGEFDAGELGRACVLMLLDQVARVFWNREQREWDRCEDPKIPGMAYQSYWWGDEDAPEASRPNLSLGDDIEVRWYKHARRGTTTQRRVTPDEWRDWINRGMALIHECDREKP